MTLDLLTRITKLVSSDLVTNKQYSLKTLHVILGNGDPLKVFSLPSLL